MAGKIAMTKEVPAVAPDAPPLHQDPFARLKEPFPPEQCTEGKQWSDGTIPTVVEWNYVCDRIEEVDPKWHHWIEAKYHGPIGNKLVVEITAHLSILGVTRLGHSAGAGGSSDIGQIAKGVETDALKRAATKFGVARYLYGGESRPTPSFKLTNEQLGAVHTAASNAGVQVGGSVSEWASGILGRVVDVVTEPITAAELDILIAAGGK